jgi:hypothetical protein
VFNTSAGRAQFAGKGRRAVLICAPRSFGIVQGVRLQEQVGARLCQTRGNANPMPMRRLTPVTSAMRPLSASGLSAKLCVGMASC